MAAWCPEVQKDVVQKTTGGVSLLTGTSRWGWVMMGVIHPGSGMAAAGDWAIVAVHRITQHTSPSYSCSTSGWKIEPCNDIGAALCNIILWAQCGLMVHPRRRQQKKTSTGCVGCMMLDIIRPGMESVLDHGGRHVRKSMGKHWSMERICTAFQKKICEHSRKRIKNWHNSLIFLFTKYQI